MVSMARRATSKLVQIMNAPGGLNTNVAALAQAESVTLPPVPATRFFTDNVASDVAEKSAELKYTAVYVYCGKIVNDLKEKFRTFSGSLQMEIDVRISQDRLDGMDRTSQLYMDAVTQILDQNRGDWGQGLFYPGGYEVSFGPVKHGGRNFIKSAIVSFQVNASVD
ncbi:MAG TPA: hypothetical protein VNH18_02670 [Bryobacteraceae bacterium]|nr:hypothetical protein [Bryobacteraceae bacterium]HXJ38152.1 hypothetical protein [Bryobacteraceae bacterium]